MPVLFWISVSIAVVPLSPVGNAASPTTLPISFLIEYNKFKKMLREGSDPLKLSSPNQIVELTEQHAWH